jgi:hypothetical protein
MDIMIVIHIDIYIKLMSQIGSQKEEYYKQLGIAPGVPTEKGQTASKRTNSKKR